MLFLEFNDSLSYGCLERNMQCTVISVLLISTEHQYMEHLDRLEAFFHPLLNPHIIEKVLLQCNYLSDLLQCRLVCRSWNEEVLRILHKQQISAVIKGPKKTLEFIHCVDSSDANPLPYSNFSVELFQHDFENLIEALLQRLESSAKHLKLEYDPLSPIDLSLLDDEESTTRKDGLSHEKICLPYTQSLHLFSTNIFPPDSEDGLHQMPELFSRLEFPKLESLSIQHMYDTDCSEVAVNLIQRSKRPLKCLKFPCTEFPKIIPHVRFQKLTELDICDLFHGSFCTNNTLQCIMESCPRLEKLSLELGFRVTLECVYRLFQTLSSTLKYLKVIIQDRNLLSRTIQRVNFQFPLMPSMEQLFLRFTNPGLVYYIDQMPRLTSLELETPWTRKVRGHIFPGADFVYRNIRVLNLSEKLTVQDIQNICKYFPSLEALCASFESNAAIQELFRSMTRLESLIVDRNSCIDDATICGLTETVLEYAVKEFLLQSAESSKHDVAADKTDNVSCSIKNLKMLKQLKLVQAGLTWKSIVFGLAVSDLRNLRSLAIQTTTLKVHEQKSITEDWRIVDSIHKSFSNLKNVTLWIRRNVERLQVGEMEFISERYKDWEVEVALQTGCSYSS